MIDLTEFTEIPLNDRVRRIDLGQIILIPQNVDEDYPFKMIYRSAFYGEDWMKARDPKLSRTLYPPFGAPMFKQDTELDKWIRNEMQIQAGRVNTKASQTTTQGTDRPNHRG